jgi:predicted peroxiredoxin
MPRYLLIESRDPFDSNDTGFCRDLATQLAAAKNEVTLFLVQNGVLPARSGARSGDLTKLAGVGVRVLADSFSLKERGIDEKRLASGIAAAPLDVVLDALAEGAKVIWH